MPWLNSLLIVVQVICAVAIIVLILLQHGKGADMGAAFGGGASGSLFGASGAANFLSRTTAVLAAIFALVFAFTGSSPTALISGVGKASAKPVHLLGVASYDPQGDNQVEHPEAVGRATDGNPTTYWETEHYNGGLNKNGVGVVLDAGKARKLSQVTVTTDTSGYTAEIEAGSSPGGPFTPVSGSEVVNGSAVFSLHGANARYYVVWITDLGSNGSVHVNEVTAKG